MALLPGLSSHISDTIAGGSKTGSWRDGLDQLLLRFRWVLRPELTFGKILQIRPACSDAGQYFRKKGMPHPSKRCRAAAQHWVNASRTSGASSPRTRIPTPRRLGSRVAPAATPGIVGSTSCRSDSRACAPWSPVMTSIEPRVQPGASP